MCPEHKDQFQNRETFVLIYNLQRGDDDDDDKDG